MATSHRRSYFQGPNWYRAYTLSERKAWANGTGPHRPEAEFDAEAASRRLQKWRSQAPFNEDENFALLLESLGLTEHQFSCLLGERAESLARRAPGRPDWLAELERLYSQDHVAQAGGPAGPSTNTRGEMTPVGFVGGLQPLFEQARERLGAAVCSLGERYPVLPFDPSTAPDLFLGHLPNILNGKFLRTMVLELNVARLQGRLRGESPGERFRDFSGRLCDPDFLIPILHEYPVLTRQTLMAIDYRVNFGREFLEHLCADWGLIKERFAGGADPGGLTQISGGVGDAHREGRAVCIATFSSGLRVVYKPRSLSVDLHFGDLLAWLNRKGAQPPFRHPALIDRGTHGWVEYVEARDSGSPEEVNDFYRRLGGYLALFYGLEASDFHLENLIAAGEHPVMVDLEALFHPRQKRPEVDPFGFTLANQLMDHSVLRVGLLPQRSWAVDVSEGVDVSGIGGRAGQFTPFPVLAFENEATDEMRAVRRRVELPGSSNRPRLEGAEVKAEDYTDDIISGFAGLYQLLLRHREELLVEGGPISQFSEDPVRAILRPTKTYGLLLTESYHPDLLRDAVDRDRLFDRLWTGVGAVPHLAKMVPAEISDLQRGDVPFFTSRPNSLDLWTSRGERIGDFFEETSLNVVGRRLRSLSEDDLARQSWFIRASMSTLTVGVGDRAVGSRLVAAGDAPGRDELLLAARAVGDRLEQLAISDVTNVSWVGLSFIGEKTWTLLPLANDLYNGVLGVSLFLAYLGAVTREERYTSLAKRALANITGRIRGHGARSKISGIGVGGYDGLGGVLYTLAHVGALCDDRPMLEACETLLDSLSDLIAQDESLDLIGGSAGCIGGLLSLHARAPSKRALGLIRQCAEHLAGRAVQMERGVGWNTRMQGPRPLTGYSHGAAGIAWALLEASALTGETGFKALAERAVDYERSVYSEEQENWPDFRADLPPPTGVGGDGGGQPAPSFQVTWCHGAPGIGLARLRARDHLDDPRLLAEVDVAISTTLRQGFGLNHSLCHGDLGNLDFLLEAGRSLGRARLLEQVNQVAAGVLKSIRDYGWLCGTPRSVETPGLMTGLAGIGYELLRLAEPGRVPSVLSMAPPPSAV